MPGLTWIQTDGHPRGIPEIIYQKRGFKKSADDAKTHEKIINHAKS